jgi:uncharacterized flavoprotein (TIGR03862 family)
MPHEISPKTIAIIGAGPAGLMAAEVLAGLGHMVHVFDAMPSVARKFLMAGKSGLNITHAEDYGAFRQRYFEANSFLADALDQFTPDDLRAWCNGLGQEVFTGSSGRVFPTSMKGSPLLRAWLKRLGELGVTIHSRHRWLGADGNTHHFSTPVENVRFDSDATLLAMGGASWPRLGSDASWVDGLFARNIAIAPFQPANCGFERHWSDLMRERFAGEPLKGVAIETKAGRSEGEFVISTYGVEGSLIYGHSKQLREDLAAHGAAHFMLDLLPGRSLERIEKDLTRASAKDSFSNRLRKALGLSPVKIALLREIDPEIAHCPAGQLARLIKGLPVAVDRPRPIAEAISCAGGVKLAEVTSDYMLSKWPGCFVAGEMLDWEAPTGGYLLTACFATGRRAALGVDQWLKRAA